MDTIILIAVFIAPGMICRTLRDSFNKERRSYTNHYEYLTQVVIDSIAVNVLTIIAANLIFKAGISDIDALTCYLQIFSNTLAYIISAGIIAAVWSGAKNKWLARLYLLAKNKILRQQTKQEHTLHTTDWDTMLSEEGIVGTWQVMSIFKDDKYIMSGMRHASSTTNAEEFEIRLDRVRLVERLLRREPQMFRIKYVYYNVSTGLRVVMYDQQLFEEHWEAMNN